MRTIIAGNWKMHKTVREALTLASALVGEAADYPAEVDVVIAPPFTALEAVSRTLRGQDRVALGAQTMHWNESGPFTGEISPLMLRDFGVDYVILGHSERRAFCGETNEYVNLKTKAALDHEITPIIAVGETLLEKEAGHTNHVVVNQTIAALQGLADADVERVILAYEPIWAIGTGRNDDPENADATMREIRGAHPRLYNVPILYGGSVKPDNMAGYAAMPNINGALVGGASLDPGSFSRIITSAVRA